MSLHPEALMFCEDLTTLKKSEFVESEPETKDHRNGCRKKERSGSQVWKLKGRYEQCPHNWCIIPNRCKRWDNKHDTQICYSSWQDWKDRQWSQKSNWQAGRKVLCMSPQEEIKIWIKISSIFGKDKRGSKERCACEEIVLRHLYCDSFQNFNIEI